MPPVAREKLYPLPKNGTFRNSDLTTMHSDGKIRLSKLMSERGICSRREADALIEKGWVLVDGKRVDVLGTRVHPDAEIALDERARRAQEDRVTILLNKPVGYVSAQAEKGYRPAISLVSAATRFPGDRSARRFSRDQLHGLAPAGRLDIDSQGLLVLTQDGRIARTLVGEDSKIEKEYLVRVRGEVTAEKLARLQHGLQLDGKALRPARVRQQNPDQLNMILTEGRKRQIRRMCEQVDLQVAGLKRVRIGRIRLGNLPEGCWRYLADDERF
jgi:23S rRNA pseudouridine2604 synthase